jgi:hypothetical protein
MKSLKNYKLSWNDFGGFFKTIYDEVNEYLDNIEIKNNEEKKFQKENSSTVSPYVSDIKLKHILSGNFYKIFLIIFHFKRIS